MFQLKVFKYIFLASLSLFIVIGFIFIKSNTAYGSEVACGGFTESCDSYQECYFCSGESCTCSEGGLIVCSTCQSGQRDITFYCDSVTGNYSSTKTGECYGGLSCTEPDSCPISGCYADSECPTDDGCTDYFCNLPGTAPGIGSCSQIDLCGGEGGYCGDEICSGTERSESCPGDCGPPGNVPSSGMYYIDMQPYVITVYPGDTARYDITIESEAGYMGNVSLAISGSCPANAECSFSPASVSFVDIVTITGDPGDLIEANLIKYSTLTITTHSNTPVGQYGISVKGTGDGFGGEEDPRTFQYTNAALEVIPNPFAACDSQWRDIPGTVQNFDNSYSAAHRSDGVYLFSAYNLSYPGDIHGLEETKCTFGLSVCFWDSYWRPTNQADNGVRSAKAYAESPSDINGQIRRFFWDYDTGNTWEAFVTGGYSTNLGAVSPAKPWGTPHTLTDKAGRPWEFQIVGTKAQYKCGPAASPSITVATNPIQVCSPNTVGTATLNVFSNVNYEIHVGSPTGTLFASEPAGTRSHTTGNWVSNGMTFYLVQTGTSNVLSSVAVTHTTAGCSVACTTLTLRPATSGFSTNPNGPASANLSVNPGTIVYAFVDYGLAGTNAIGGPVSGGYSCAWDFEFIGNAARFKCSTIPASGGSYIYSTSLTNYPPPDSNICADNSGPSIGTLTVNSPGVPAPDLKITSWANWSGTGRNTVWYYDHVNGPIEVYANANYALLWGAVANATSCTLDGVGVSTSATTVNTYSATLLTKTHTLSCRNASNQTGTDTVIATIPPPPTNLTKSCNALGNQMTILWNLPSGYTNSYFSAALGSNVTTADPALSSEGNFTSRTITVVPNQTYSVWAQTKNLTNTAWSNSTAMNAICVPSYPLTVTKAGTGTGTVTSNPAGISCGSDCTENYTSGTSVTLTAAVISGSTFAGWSGGVCTGTGTCTVSMTQARNVTATFNLTAATCDSAPGTNFMKGCVYQTTNFGSYIGATGNGPTASGNADGFTSLPRTNVLATSGSTVAGQTTNFSARWKGTFTFTGGNYDFQAGSDDGERVYIDSALVWDTAWVSGRPYAADSFTTAISVGPHTITYEYNQGVGGAEYSLAWALQAAPNQLPTVPSVTVTEPDYCSSVGAYVNWTYSDPDGDPQSAYQVQVDDQSSFNNPEIDSGKVSGSGATYFASGLDFDITYKARVRVWDSHDSVSGWTVSGSWKTPKHAYPYVDFIYAPSTDIPAKQPVQFTDQTTFYDGGGTRTWKWLFKAPSSSPSSTLQNPAYTYDSSGTYDVTETATDKDNYSCSRTKQLNIAQPVPVWKEVSPR